MFSKLHSADERLSQGHCKPLKVFYISWQARFQITINDSMERYPVISQIAHLNCVYMSNSCWPVVDNTQCLMLCGSYIAKKQSLSEINCTNPNAAVPRAAFGDYTACSCMYYFRLSSAHEQVGSAQKWWDQLLTCLTACYSHVSTTKRNSFQVLSHHPKLPLFHPFWSYITKPTPTESLVVKGQAQCCFEAI